MTFYHVVNSEVAGSILTVIPENNRDFLTFQEPVKLNHFEKTMRKCIGSLQVTPIPKKSHWVLGISSEFMT